MALQTSSFRQQTMWCTFILPRNVRPTRRWNCDTTDSYWCKRRRWEKGWDPGVWILVVTWSSDQAVIYVLDETSVVKLLNPSTSVVATFTYGDRLNCPSGLLARIHCHVHENYVGTWFVRHYRVAGIDTSGWPLIWVTDRNAASLFDQAMFYARFIVT